MQIEWSESYNIGDAEIDAKRQQMFALINSLISSKDVMSMRAVVMRLYKHVREQFVLEEALMHRRSYAGYDVHRSAHQKLIERLDVLSMDVGKGSMNKSGLIALLTDWAATHVPQDDAQLAQFLVK